eukprot:CAMPEP_0168330036 /NCGR_PEP_ID=MMETSP0213-20121227/7471_1 /TAXON_ID=151035 /ORGANISM="Euplotes harpa, Strain FSP1.4" /LENGTH=195 /DNA_ID=CAMNT_0008333489 /DNA_START=158 /DNA_END=745 /DNA_ORIENTATION=+
MILIPFFLVEILKCYGYANINYGLNNFGSRGDIHGLIMASVFCGITVGLYWLLCEPLHVDLKSVAKELPFPKDTLLKVMAIVYFILIKPYVEEWFWRRYNYDIFMNSTQTSTSSNSIINSFEFDFWIVSFFWALTYTVIAIKAGAGVGWAIGICLIFMALGRFLIWMRWEHGAFTHLGICGGVVICYFLAESGKF